ncbi:MAG: hypothetical protein FJX23_01595 [Alphaproteobacteria bacterium]|nr:hypothetical protein [Alphaproteobacteria bacterium]
MSQELENAKKLAILALDNGMRVITTHKVLDEVLGDDQKKSNLTQMVNRIASASKGTGLTGDLPIFLRDQPENNYSCSAGVYGLDDTLRMLSSALETSITHKNTGDIWPTKQDLEKLAPAIIISSGCLDEQNRFYQWDEFEAVAAHEIGHILRQDVDALRIPAWGLSGKLHQLALARDSIVHSADGESATSLLPIIDAQFKDAGKRIDEVLSFAEGEKGGHYAEGFIDHFTGGVDSTPLLASAEKLPSIPHDVLGSLMPSLPTEGDERRAYTSAPQEVQDVLEKAHTLAFLASAATESLADDVATRHTPTGAQNLFNTFHHKIGISGVVAGPQHYSGAERYARSKILADTREGMAAKDELDESAATRATNQAMRDIHDTTQDLKKDFAATRADAVTMTNAHKAWTRRSLHLAPMEDLVELAGGKQWLNNVEGAGIKIAAFQRSYRDRIKAESDAKSPSGNAR